MITRRQFLKGCAGVAATISGISLFTEYKEINQFIKSIPILLYHRVGSEPDDLTISVKHFEQDMELLSYGGYNALSLEQVKQHLQGNSSSLPSKPIVITFDDGYLDNYINAFPILQKYSMVASFYIITGMVGNNDRLTIPQIREMQAVGMDFGSHTITHRSLGELVPKDVATELNQSKSDLEQIIGKSVDFISYPCGSYKSETLQIAREAGYLGGFSVQSGFAEFSNPLTIRRIPIFHHDRSIAYVMAKKGFLPRIFG
ncbi:polysaccharide deacetylase family protein [Pelosinus sp. sgz500959]|uniref:polysaccharide deacetylase family protein n=1 Tax=Pelosinus sp. sgz500959 TaxID=3242472 RepID=UPI00366B2C1D